MRNPLAPRAWRATVITVLTSFGLALATAAHAADKCREGASRIGDARAIAGLRAVIDAQCPCATFDGSSSTTSHSAFLKCVKIRIGDATDGTPLLGFSLRAQCKGEFKKIFSNSTCGYPANERVACCEVKPANGKLKAGIKKVASCVDSASGTVVRHACTGSPFTVDACSFDPTNSCTTTTFAEETVNLPSAAEPPHTPGSTGVVVTNPKLLTQFGGGSFSLNNARYTRHHLAAAVGAPDAILVLVPGFEGGAGNFRILAQNLLLRAQGEGVTLEVWAYDRRSNQLEDLAGLNIAEQYSSPEIAQDWLFGGELTLMLHPVLAAGPNRRAVFYDTQADLPFFADWSPLVFSRDIDAIVTAAAAAAVNQNVFLGGHSAGTGFTARYAATDFNLTGVGPADPGYAKLRGLVLLEGGGGSTGGTPLTADTLDRIEAKFDGGLHGAVRDNAGRCVNGTTLCAIASEAADCLGQVPPKCTPPTTAYSSNPLLNARVLSAGEVTAIQAILDPDTTENILRVDQGAVGNNALAKVPDLANLGLLPRSTAFAGLGNFVDDDGLVAGIAPFVAVSVGAVGPTSPDGAFQTWFEIPGFVPASATPYNGPAPTTLPGAIWGQEREVTRFDRLIGNFYVGDTNFTDTYYPSSGLSVTSVTGVCDAFTNTCSVGKVGSACTVATAAADCSQAVNLDSSALSIGRNRRDIENLTQAAAIDIPVIAFGGSNGLTPVAGNYTAFGSSIGTCTAPSCDGTPRVVDASSPNPAFPTFGDVAGGFEVVIAEGFAHLDVLTAEDSVVNPVTPALVDFLKRNIQ
jgi:pimeloyl-ACP methyl ester carboxylesterase